MKQSKEELKQSKESCDELKKALAAAKARLYQAPVRSTSDIEAGDIGLSMHMYDHDAVNAEIDRIERALHENGCE